MKRRIKSLNEFIASFNHKQVYELRGDVHHPHEYLEVENWLDEIGVKNYTINKNLTVDVDGDVDFSKRTFKILPIQFGTVSGNFSISNCPNIKTLEGCPEEVGGSFSCDNCISIKSLEECPLRIKQHLSCSECTSLESLIGCPKQIFGDFQCSYCPNLKTLKGCPKEVRGNFSAEHCGGNFTEEEIKEICNVKKRIHI